VGFPALDGELLPSAQANAVIGLSVSVELEMSDTCSPTCGEEGNHVNEAAGGDGGRTVSETGWLKPTFPALSDCSARSV
jgi:hypothetical protein